MQGSLSRVQQIIEHEQRADELAAKAEEHRWEAARLISEELAAGKTQRQLGDEIGKSHEHVRLMSRCWQLKLPGDERSFNQVYNSDAVRQPWRAARPPGKIRRGTTRGPSEQAKRRQHQDRYDRWAADPHKRFLAAMGWLNSMSNSIDSLQAEDLAGISAEDAAELDMKIHEVHERLNAYLAAKLLAPIFAKSA